MAALDARKFGKLSAVDVGSPTAFARNVPAQQIYQLLFSIFAFIFGACIGSFLNVCIYRMPRNLSVNEPKRSFCPSCKYQIPWSSNLPILTWVLQRGKCRNCGSPIAFRYVLVEFLTGLLFLAAWWRVVWLHPAQPSQWVLFFPWAVFISMLVVATFVDFEFLEIPDQITIGGTIVGIVLSFAIPPLHGQVWGNAMGHLLSGAWSLAGAATGYALLWLVSNLGKLAFGRKSKTFPVPAGFTWTRTGDSACLKVGPEELQWIDLFSSEKDILVMDCARLEFEGVVKENFELRSRYEKLEFEGKEYDLNKVDSFQGTVRKISWKRDAMGYGDVKFMACIGAFLGWQAVLFTVMAASVIGAVVGGMPLLIGRRNWSPKIPFGPYLSLGALLWIFCGHEIVAWYLSFSAPPEPEFPGDAP
jgi:leader peptidase (prepilin peptidase)/N-methyltransferase